MGTQGNEIAAPSQRAGTRAARSVSDDHETRRQRRLRQLKRDIKRAGSKRRRRHLKRELREHPEDAPYSECDFGRNSSAGLNRLDRDATRRKPENYDLE